jgi:hypothetical protein
MKTKIRTNRNDDILIQASFELYQMKVKATETELETIEIEKSLILNDIAQNETGISNETQRFRLAELTERESNLHSKWNELEMSYQVGSLSESIQPEKPIELKTPTDWLNTNQTEMSESEIAQTLDELEQLRDSEPSPEEERDLLDF